MNAAERLNEVDGVKLTFRARGAASIVEMPNFVYAQYRDYLFEVMTTADRFYAPVSRMTAVDAAGAGDVDLTWILPAVRPPNSAWNRRLCERLIHESRRGQRRATATSAPRSTRSMSSVSADASTRRYAGRITTIGPLHCAAPILSSGADI